MDLTRIFDFGYGSATNMYLTPKNRSNSKIRFGIKNNGSSEQIIDGTSALPTGGWHHVAVTLNGETGILYVDGVQVGSNSAMTIKPSDMFATTFQSASKGDRNGSLSSAAAGTRTSAEANLSQH